MKYNNFKVKLLKHERTDQSFRSTYCRNRRIVQTCRRHFIIRQHPIGRDKGTPLIVWWVRLVSVSIVTISPIAVTISEAEESSVIAQVIIIKFLSSEPVKATNIL